MGRLVCPLDRTGAEAVLRLHPAEVRRGVDRRREFSLHNVGGLVGHGHCDLCPLPGPGVCRARPGADAGPRLPGRRRQPRPQLLRDHQGRRLEGPSGGGLPGHGHRERHPPPDGDPRGAPGRPRRIKPTGTDLNGSVPVSSSLCG